MSKEFTDKEIRKAASLLKKKSNLLGWYKVAKKVFKAQVAENKINKRLLKSLNKEI